MKRYDATILGAGPAGAEAAIAAREFGLKTLVIDEGSAAGGQIYRSQASSEGIVLRRRLNESGVDCAFEHRVWNAGAHPDGFELWAAGPAGPLVVQSAALIIATGAIERFYPRPGWTLPGVIGLGAATLMIKTHNVLPGTHVAVAGPGPLAPLVANLILRNGGKVVALIDPNPLSVWIQALPEMARRLDLLIEGARWQARLRARRVPILHGWEIRKIHGKQDVEAVTVRSLSSGRIQQFPVNTVCMGDGLTPATEFYRVLDAALEFDPDRGGWVPKLDTAQRTSVPRLYAAGDGASLSGVAAAPLTGRIAAAAAAFDLGKLPETDYRLRLSESIRRLSSAARFGRVMARMTQPRASAMEKVDDSTIVCRCEDISAGELRAAIRTGSSEMNSLKAATRCGMGPCGGRICSEAASALMECAGLERKTIGYWTARPPLRPVPVDALTGVFTYEDIPGVDTSPM